MATKKTDCEKYGHRWVSTTSEQYQKCDRCKATGKNIDGAVVLCANSVRTPVQVKPMITITELVDMFGGIDIQTASKQPENLRDYWQ